MDDSVDPPEFDEGFVRTDTKKSAASESEKPVRASASTSRRSSANRCFLLAGFLGLILIGLLVVSAVLLFQIRSNRDSNKLKDITEVEESYSESEVKTAKAMIQMMDFSVEPCNDFYKFACGGWIRSMSDSKTIKSIQDQENQKILIQFKELMARPPVTADPPYKRKPREFFAACNDTGKRKNQGKTPFLNLVKSVGMFPILTKNWDQANFVLQDVLTKLAKLDVQPLFVVSIDTNAGFTGAKFVIDRPTIESDWMFAQEWPHPAYMAWTEEVLKSLGVDTDNEEILIDLEDAFDVEGLVLNINQSAIDPDYDIQHDLNIGDLESYLPELKWMEYLQELTAGTHGINQTITWSTQVTVQMGYDLIPSLKKVMASNKKILANYLMKSLLPFTHFLYPPTRKFKGEFLPLPYPDKVFNECYGFTLGYFDLQLSRTYLDEIANKSKQAFIQEMMNEIKGFIRSGVEKTNWLNADYKKKLIEKVTVAGDLNIPEKLSKIDDLNHMHDSLTTTDFFEFFTSLARYNFKRGMNRARKEKTVPTLPDPTKPEMYLFSLAAARESVDLNNKRSFIFATTGILKTFRIISQLMMKLEGDVQNSNLFAYMYCQKNYFPEFVKTFKHWETSITANDSVALMDAFKAYQNYNKRNEEKPLPDLGMNNNQLFFLSYAQSFCQWIPPGSEENNFSFPERIRGTLINSVEFAETFECKEESHMNAGIHCKIL